MCSQAFVCPVELLYLKGSNSFPPIFEKTGTKSVIGRSGMGNKQYFNFGPGANIFKTHVQANCS